MFDKILLTIAFSGLVIVLGIAVRILVLAYFGV